jgi:hypothetical protein
MRIFISYSSPQRGVAEEVALSLAGYGHDVFFDRSLLQPGDEYDRRLWEEIARADVLVFLISPASVARGSYARTELRFAQQKWSHPAGHVLPVVVEPVVPLVRIPAYLRAVTLLTPAGNVAAEIAAQVATMRQVPRLPAPGRVEFLDKAVAAQRRAMRARARTAVGTALVGECAVGLAYSWGGGAAESWPIALFAGLVVAALAGVPLRDREVRRQKIDALVLLRQELDWCLHEAGPIPEPRCETAERQFERYHAVLLGV